MYDILKIIKKMTRKLLQCSTKISLKCHLKGENMKDLRTQKLEIMLNTDLEFSHRTAMWEIICADIADEAMRIGIENYCIITKHLHNDGAGQLSRYTTREYGFILPNKITSAQVWASPDEALAQGYEVYLDNKG